MTKSCQRQNHLASRSESWTSTHPRHFDANLVQLFHELDCTLVGALQRDQREEQQCQNDHVQHAKPAARVFPLDILWIGEVVRVALQREDRGHYKGDQYLCLCLHAEHVDIAATIPAAFPCAQVSVVYRFQHMATKDPKCFGLVCSSLAHQ
eukprot:SAG22_NODE_709_length_7742_cov_2.383488_3_plen_151_part_00